MEGFDDPGVFFSDNFGVEENQSQDQVNLQAVKKKFKEFIRQFHAGNFNYKYRDALKRNYNLGQYWVEINIEDLSSFDEVLAEKLYKKPTEHLPILEEAAKDLADELTAPRPEGEEKVEDIQVLLSSDAHASNLRELKSETVSRLVKIPGIVISASGIKAKATKISIQCRSCRNIIPNLPVKPGLEGYVMPRKCNTEQAGRPKCPLDPYFIIPDKCKCIDYQVLKLQETPESIPQGEMPRHLTVYCDRTLCERVAPGARVSVLGIYSIKKIAKFGMSPNVIKMASRMFCTAPKVIPRVCIVGAGPAGFYAAMHLTKHLDNVNIDIMEKLPVPFGLIRYGVAPDHPEVKNCINQFTKVAQKANVNFYGNIVLGQHITLSQLRQHYDAVLLTYGAEEDRNLGIENENGKNIIAARNFVGWYNGLPSDKDLKVDLSGPTAAILGQGNVALDVARILLSPIDKLKTTDITEHALSALAESKIKDLYLVGRRGPLQVAFTIKELREQLKIENSKTIWRPEQFTGVSDIVNDLQRPRKRLTELMLKSLNENHTPSDDISVRHFRLVFFRSPHKFILNEQKKVTGVEFICNKLVGDKIEEQRCVPTDEKEIIECSLAFRSIGYKSVNVDKDLVFAPNGFVANERGKVFDAEMGMGKVYAAGWLGTGPVGVILHTMGNAFQVAKLMVEDIKSSKQESKGGFEEVKKLLNTHIVDWKGWERIDQYETEEGKKKGKPREKICSVDKMIEIASRGGDKGSVGVRSSYLRAVGLTTEEGVTGGLTPFTAEEEEQFRRLAASPDIYERIAKSIAPSIFGAVDMKKAIACLLFGGSRKKLPDGLTRRGDINILLLGDPGTAKSQLLKFVERVSPIGVYTSGKGSSAAGLTASVIRDPGSRNFVMEGGAMVLADGGVVCIDEFDKMREDDRVAIHEAMEQQTISIAKAGITTTLNSRCSVLAAANSVFGRWDDTKADDNIDFMPTILSRFDMIFIVKDEHNEGRDITLAKHIISVHMGGDSAERESSAGELPVALLRRYSAYCRARCGPRLSAGAAQRLQARYVLMRSGASQHERQADKRLSIPITVRQLEAVIRISESLAKMQLQPFATEAHVTEALRLFQVSTLDAAMTGTLAGAEGFTTEEDHEILSRIEKQLKRRFAVGSQVSEQTIIQDFLRQKYPERSIIKVIHTMIRRGELQHRLQRKMLYRLS
ncbi:hypothetical protein O0L34_g845 [Tuta absoluta]|nr:hypothetical protein O0L34_g845 [Tuta absoluta]